MDAAHSPSSSAFGVRVGGVALFLPQGEPLEYFAAAVLYPLPLAGRRVTGVMQVRGHPVVVVEPGVPPARIEGTLARLPVLVIGEGSEAGGLRVDGPPEPLQVIDGAPATPPAGAPDCVFRHLLREAVIARPVGRIDVPATPWWRFEPRRLFEALSGSDTVE